MKICASFSYQCGLEICPTEISKLFLIKITSRSLICIISLSHSLYKYLHFTKRSVFLPTPEEEMQISCRFFFTARVQPDALDW